jgi:coenzyme F420-reducing hydrogenase alpha subunit
MVATRTRDLHIDLHHLTRVEGHGNLVVEIRDGQLERCELEVVEAPRFFEAMLRGRPHDQAPHVASRICGICSVAHSTASILAVKALGSTHQQTRQLRGCFMGEMLDSHILHAYLLVAPDLFGKGSAVALASSRPDVVVRALTMKKLAGDLCAAVGGRHTHPVAMAVGGFHHFPQPAELAGLRARLVQTRPDLAPVLHQAEPHVVDRETVPVPGIPGIHPRVRVPRPARER